MNVAKFSVTRPVAVTMRIAALVLLGAICLTRLPIDLLPKIAIPTVVVITSWPNVGAEEMEASITRPIERAVSSVPGLYQINSTSSEGNSMVRVQLTWGTDIGAAAVDVLQLVQRARREFPTDPTLQTPIVFKFDPSQMPVLNYGVSGIDDPVKLRTLLDNQVLPIIESAEGVASVTITGGQQRAIMVEIDPQRLRAHNLSLAEVSRRIAQENLNLPAGIAKQSDTEYTVRTMGWFASPKDIEGLPVVTRGGRTVTIGDVAEVKDSTPETRVYTRLNGQPAVGIIITKQSGANTVGTVEAVQKKLEQVKKLYPQLHFGLAADQSSFIKDSINNLQHHAMIGGVLAILILLFFLRNIRSTLVVALSIPISIVSTFALLYMCGFTLNVMSLGGLALATGLIVDDAVVVLENIFRHIERDKKRAAEAAVSGTNEIMSAVLASTFTVMVVFLPLLLIKGQAGQMFTQFALVVIFSLAVSLLDAATVVPMLASRVIKGEAHHENVEDGHKRNLLERLFHRFGKWFDAMDNSYRNGLRWALRHRIMVVGGAATVSVVCLLLVPYIGTEVMPKADSGDFTVNLRMPQGTSLEKTDKAVAQIEKALLANKYVATTFAASGANLRFRGAVGSPKSNEGAVIVDLKQERDKSTTDVMADLRKEFAKIPGARAFPQQTDMVANMITGGPSGLEVNIFGDDLATLNRLGKEAMGKLRDIPGLESVDLNWQEASPEIQWRVDREKASQFGLSFQDIATAVGTATNGNIASYYQEGGFQFPIIVQLPITERKTVAELMTLPVRTSSGPNGEPGPSVLLGQVAKDQQSIGPNEITRQDRQRYIAVTGQAQGRSEGEIQKDVAKALAGWQLPQGYYWDWGRRIKEQAEESGGMWLSIVLAICLIYMLLASQFESFIHPLTVLLSVPLSAVGVVLAFFLTDRTFGLTAFIGILMLVGIVVKNGILLVDYTNVLRGRGITRDEAVLTAGPTRLRPILMTTLATIFGMLPIAIGLGRGSETQAPMATAVIGGLMTSTMLTLFVIPTVYTLFDDLGRFFRKDKLDLSRAELVEPSVEAIEAVPGPPQAAHRPEPVD
jgi:hydrophobic/amphiphilic exporter-1 (mainly G- bacteria), HAE1 family